MIRLEIEIEDLDYNALLERFLPAITEALSHSENPAAGILSAGVPASMARALIAAMPQEKKERLTAELINSNSPRLGRRAEELAAREGIRLRVRDIRASGV